jgi:hypothetical protein
MKARPPDQRISGHYIQCCPLAHNSLDLLAQSARIEIVTALHFPHSASLPLKLGNLVDQIADNLATGQAVRFHPNRLTNNSSSLKLLANHLAYPGVVHPLTPLLEA